MFHFKTAFDINVVIQGCSRLDREKHLSGFSTAFSFYVVPMKKVARSLHDHRELLLNWLSAKGRLSVGVVEGFNNKVKLTVQTMPNAPGNGDVFEIVGTKGS